MTGPFVALSTAAPGTPVQVTATVGERRWWARVRQFQRSAYVEVWNDAGYDAEAVVPCADVGGEMAATLQGPNGVLPVTAGEVLARAALTFTAACGSDGATMALRALPCSAFPADRSLLPVARPA